MKKLISRTLYLLSVQLSIFTITASILKCQPIASLEKMVAASDRIVVGNVINTESKWDESRTTIWTYVTVRCQQFLKGPDLQNEITIRVMGGKIGQLGLDVSHTPTFQNGERVLVFLQENEKGVFDVVNWREGKYTIKDDKLEKMGRDEPLSFIEKVKAVVKQDVIK